MAAARHLGIADAGFTAATDLTSKQYYFVMPGSVAGEVKIANGGSDVAPLGVLQNSPSAGQEARVRVLGFSKVYAVAVSGCEIGYGAFVQCNANGEAIRAIPTSPCMAVAGRWIDAAVSSTASRYGECFVLGMPLAAMSGS